MNDPSNQTALAPLGSGAMFDGIASRYDLLNRVLSLGLDQRWRRRLVNALQLPDGACHVLDLATGTADVAIAIADRWPNATVLGTDPSAAMMRLGEKKIARARLAPRIRLVAGDAQAIEAHDESFDGVTMAFGIRNVPDRLRALREMHRVVRPGGRVCILELSEAEQGLLGSMARIHTRHVVPRLAALLSGAREYRYLQTSIAAFPRATVFAELMRDAGLHVVATERLTFGAVHLYIGERPAHTARGRHG